MFLSNNPLSGDINSSNLSCLKLLSILIGATFKGKNILPMGSIFFPLIVAPFKK